MSAKKVFVPATLLHPTAEAVFQAAVDAGEIEIIRGVGDGSPELLQLDLATRRQLADEANARLEEVLPEIQGVVAMGPYGHIHIRREMIERAERLEVICVPGSGTENIDLDAATEAGVAVVNSSGSNMRVVSDHAFGLILNAARRIGFNDRFHHNERRWLPYNELIASAGQPMQISRRTLGIIGLGFIGREVARKARLAFEMRVLGYDPFVDPMEIDRQGIEKFEDLTAMIPQCDVVTVHASMTPSAYHIVDEQVLRLMQPHAVLVNCARGGAVDTEALTRALQEKWIAGAAIDVTEPEPLPDGHPLFGLENCTITSHSAGAEATVREPLATIAAQAAVQALRGERPWRLVNPAVWPKFAERQTAARV